MLVARPNNLGKGRESWIYCLVPHIVDGLSFRKLMLSAPRLRYSVFSCLAFLGSQV